MTRSNRNGQIYGTAGGGLEDASWAANADVARIGQRGEQRTAALLDKFAQRPGGVTVLHDLAIPIPGFNANIDHVVVSGRRVFLVDAKMWKPGRYWTHRGRTRRGWERFAPAEKKTMQMAYDRVGSYLAKRGVSAQVVRPVVVVWPSSGVKPLRLRLLRIPGADAMTPRQFESWCGRNFKRKARPADPVVVASLARLLHDNSTVESIESW